MLRDDALWSPGLGRWLYDWGRLAFLGHVHMRISFVIEYVARWSVFMPRSSGLWIQKELNEARTPWRRTAAGSAGRFSERPTLSFCIWPYSCWSTWNHDGDLHRSTRVCVWEACTHGIVVPPWPAPTPFESYEVFLLQQKFLGLLKGQQRVVTVCMCVCVVCEETCTGRGEVAGVGGHIGWGRVEVDAVRRRKEERNLKGIW